MTAHVQESGGRVVKTIVKRKGKARNGGDNCKRT